MSVTGTSRVFWTNIPDLTYKNKFGKIVKVSACTCKMVLLAIADNSNDYCENSWQSFDTLATKSSLEKRSVMRAVKALCDNKYLIVNGISEYGTNNYALNVALLGEQPPRRRRGASDAESLVKMGSSDPDASTSDSEAIASDSRAITSDVKSPESSLTIIKPCITQPPNFSDMTVREAMAIPELQRFRDATGYFPGSPVWETIYNDIHQNKWTVEQIKKPWVEWCKRGYNTKSLSWMEWISSPIPDRQKPFSNNKPEPVNMIEVQKQRIAESFKRLEMEKAK